MGRHSIIDFCFHYWKETRKAKCPQVSALSGDAKQEQTGIKKKPLIKQLYLLFLGMDFNSNYVSSLGGSF